MANKIKQMKLKKFRGATDETVIDFDCQKHMVVIFGENGTGKTTILDAIDFACNQCSDVSLKNKSIGKNKHKFIHSILSKISDLKVEVTMANDNNCSATLGSNGDVSVSRILPRAEILRRDSILKIVAGQPKERFEEIRNMVAYPKIKNIEDALRAAYKNSKQNYDDSIKAYHQAETDMQNAWDEAGDHKTDYLKWAEGRASVSADDLEKEKNDWESKWKKMQKLKDQMEYLDKLKEAYANIQVLFKAKQDELQNKLKNEAEKQELVPLLEKAKSYIEGQDSLSACPVCSSGVEKNELLKNIDDRIDQMKDLKKIQDEIFDFKKKNETQIAQIKDAETTVNNIKQEIHELFDTKEHDNVKDSKAIIDQIAVLEKNTLEKQKEFNQLALIQRTYKTYIEKKEDAEKGDKKTEKIKQLLEELELVRKNNVDAVLKTVSKSVERMYLKVHPNEGIGEVKFYLDPNKAESLEFDGEFQGNSVPPQAYYSESHLDTLGVCVFLALAQNKCSDGILLMDDVFTSIDQQHMSRFIDMLEDEAKNFGQIIISTHYRLWRDRYKMPIQQAHDIELIELLPWTSDAGVRHTRTKFYVEEIQTVLNKTNFERQQVASKAGILLEHILDELALKYSLDLPRKSEHKYTLGQLFIANAKMRDKLKVEKNGSTYDLKQIVNDLHNSAFVRNEVGCHYSETGALLSDDDVRDFGSKAIDFANLILCDNCGAFPNKKRSGSYWECQCGELKLYPLCKP
ncbi:MAG: AAA family ATPase [Elusimicrobiota bacterium]